MLINRLMFSATIFVISMATTCSVVSLMLLDSGSAADGWTALAWLWVAVMLFVMGSFLVMKHRAR